RYDGTGRGDAVVSSASCPAIASSTMATSATSRPSGPTWSRDDAYAMTPYRDTRPYVGLSPTTPQKAAGSRTDPPVSVPSAAWHSRAAPATPEPPEDPPGPRAGSHGFRVTPSAEFSVDEPIANSSQLSFPTMTAPAARSRAVTVAS